MARSDPQLNFRLPQELKDRIEQSAKDNKRSITAELIERLENSFKYDPNEAVSTIKVITFDDLTEPAMTIEFSSCVIGFIKSQYHEVELEKNKPSGLWQLKYKALRSIIKEPSALQLLEQGCTLIK